MQNEPRLESFSKEEGEKILNQLQSVLSDNKADLIVFPIINPNGTLGAKVELYKKTTQDPIVSPIKLDDESGNSEKTTEVN